MYLEDVRREESGRFADRGVKGINLGLAIDQNTSAYKIYIIKDKTIRITNHVKFDESYFPVKEAAMRRMPCIADEAIETQDAFPPEEGTYLVSFGFQLLEAGFKVEMYDRAAGMYTCTPRDFPRCRIMITDAQHQEQLQAWIARAETERRAIADGTMPPPFVSPPDNYAAAAHVLPPPVLPPPLPTQALLPPPPYAPRPQASNPAATPKEGTRMEGLPDSIDPTKPPKNFKDANSREDAQEWMDAYFKEYKGMMDQGAVKAVKPPPGAKLLGTTTRLEYKSW
jgi:hypothetical protein